jgi:hypothetical protein
MQFVFTKQENTMSKEKSEYVSIHDRQRAIDTAKDVEKEAKKAAELAEEEPTDTVPASEDNGISTAEQAWLSGWLKSIDAQGIRQTDLLIKINRTLNFFALITILGIILALLRSCGVF